MDDAVLDAISSQFLFQLGFLLILPIPLLLAVEQVRCGAVQLGAATLCLLCRDWLSIYFLLHERLILHYPISRGRIDVSEHLVQQVADAFLFSAPSPHSTTTETDGWIHFNFLCEFERFYGCHTHAPTNCRTTASLSIP